MGCGRVGSSLAIELESAGHSVAIIDQSKEAFRRLGPDFKGRTVVGVGFDRDTLLEAGIEGADAFAAVSNGDNSNILAARVARESYGVTNVVARIYDPGRAEIYQRLGIPILRRIAPGGARSEWRDATGTVQLLEVHPHVDWYGRAISDLEAATESRVAFLTRLGEALVPDAHTVLQDGDLVHMTILDEKLAIAESVLTSGPGE
jgi:trk system potassium uptake protein TrkA